MGLIKIIYDYDDVLTEFVKSVSIKSGCNIEKLTRFNIKECNISDEMKNAIFTSFNNIQSYKDAEWVDGVDTVLNISKLNEVDFLIHSHCLSKEIADYKKDRLITFGFDESKVFMEVGASKNMLDADFMIDDCLANLVNSHAKEKLTVDRQWNNPKTNMDFLELLKNDSFKRFSNLNKANEYIIDRLKKEGVRVDF